MREMKDSGIEWIGYIPKDWSLKKARYMFLQRNEKGNNLCLQLLSPSQKYGVIPQCLLEELTTQTAVKLKENTDLNSLKTVHKGDFCISLRSFQGGFEFSEYEGVVSPAYQIFYKSSDIANKYYKYMFKDSSFISKMNSYTMSMRDGKNISYFDFGNSYLPFPSFDEQKKISDYLDQKCSEIDTISSDIQKQISVLEDYKKSVIAEAVTKGLNPNVEMKDSGIEWIGAIPKYWSLTKIGMLYTLRNTKVSDKEYQPLSVTKMGVLPQLETVAKTNAHDDRKLVKKGDFAINSRSDRRGSCGISSFDGSVSLINTVLTPRERMHPGFYNWLFHTIQFADEFYKNGHGIVDDLWTTNWQDMKKIVLPIPMYDEQQVISDYLDQKCSEIDTLISDKKKQLEILAEYKKSLIYEYVTGKKEVPES